MRNLLLNNWRAKLVCLALAIAIWYIVRQNVIKSPFSPEWIRHSMTATDASAQ